MITYTEPEVRLIASPKSWIEGEAIRQLCATSKLDGMNLAIGFPDLHPGKGSPVGAAFVTQGMLYPFIVGGDIGCGMGLWKTGLLKRKAKLDRWAEIRFDLEHPWEGNVQERLARAGLNATPFSSALGTVGGGNHFAELQAVEKVFDESAFHSAGLASEKLCLLVHSGSRGLGESILREYVGEHGATGVSPESAAGQAYLDGHDHAMRWAEENRALIAERFLDCLGVVGEKVIEGCHNSVTPIETELGPVWLHRKGAAPADRGPVVIPGSRGSLSYLVQPQGDIAASGWSLAHGAGRKWTRSAARARARERFSVDELIQTPLGSRVICESRELLYEEAPMAYKNIEQVIADLVDAGLISVIATLRPLLTYKTRLVRW
ncbi:MAG TPA: RNA ligase RtcB family protein [Candidatus Saccharimonadales bacterium]|nr:RNA ligase RtcB family protein [Candidatus Saccharimonadales bacterium]